MTLSFDIDKHEYRYNGEVMTSVTTLVKQYSHEFVPMDHAPRIAEREGRTVGDVLEEWDKKAREAADMGTAVHAYAEKLAQEWPNPIFCLTDPLPKTRGVNQWYASRDLRDPKAERRVCWPEHKIAGTVDLTFTLGGKPTIGDWKTSQKIDKFGFGVMKPPFDKGPLALPDCNYSHYCLQMNLYRMILAKAYGENMERMVLIHLDGASFAEYDIPIMENHVNAALGIKVSSQVVTGDFTALVVTCGGVIVESAPIISGFIGKPSVALHRWLKNKFGGYEVNRL